MTPVLVDSNVILDIASGDLQWAARSAAALQRVAEESVLIINPIIYAEVSVVFERIEDVEEALPALSFRRVALPQGWDTGDAARASAGDARNRNRRPLVRQTLVPHRLQERLGLSLTQAALQNRGRPRAQVRHEQRVQRVGELRIHVTRQQFAARF